MKRYILITISLLIGLAVSFLWLATSLPIDMVTTWPPLYEATALTGLAAFSSLMMLINIKRTTPVILAGFLCILAPPACTILPAWAKTDEAVAVGKTVGRVLSQFALTAAANNLREGNPLASAILLASLQGLEPIFSSPGDREASFDKQASQFEADLEATLAASPHEAERQVIRDKIALALESVSK